MRNRRSRSGSGSIRQPAACQQKRPQRLEVHARGCIAEQRRELRGDRGGGASGRRCAAAQCGDTGVERGRCLLPLGGQRREPAGITGVADVRQRAFERLDGVWRKQRRFRAGQEVRRSQQCHGRRASGIRADERQHEIERRRTGLGGERQRVITLEGHAAASNTPRAT